MMAKIHVTAKTEPTPLTVFLSSTPTVARENKMHKVHRQNMLIAQEDRFDLRKWIKSRLLHGVAVPAAHAKISKGTATTIRICGSPATDSLR
jgi:hypothetical protein